MLEAATFPASPASTASVAPGPVRLGRLIRTLFGSAPGAAGRKATPAYRLRQVAEEGPGEAMLLAHDGDADAYRIVLRWSERWLRIYFEYHGPDLNRDQVADAVNATLMLLHAKRHTFDNACTYARWLEAIARYKTPVLVGHRYKRPARKSASVDG